MLLIVLAGALYVAYSLNLLGPMMQMSNAAWGQGVELGKQKLRDFLESNEMARQAIGVPATGGGRRQRQDSDISLETLDSRGRRAMTNGNVNGAADDGDEI